ncbi:hypothetical protein [Virgibacillus doumboii]|uniref:hypothetical protein n=1 Tax=Virgibacillus doumboii TaxID=2697503 RepID=UPI0013DF2581|nr:hypothetical protein [Virgibacillus doumboii]
MNIESLFNKDIRIKVLRAYLYKSMSHRQIQREILHLDAPARGGGFVAMQILHFYGIDGKKKGILSKSSIESEYKTASDEYRRALDLIL